MSNFWSWVDFYVVKIFIPSKVRYKSSSFVFIERPIKVKYTETCNDNDIKDLHLRDSEKLLLNHIELRKKNDFQNSSHTLELYKQLQFCSHYILLRNQQIVLKNVICLAVKRHVMLEFDFVSAQCFCCAIVSSVFGFPGFSF